MFEILYLTFISIVKSLEFNLLKPAETMMPQNHCHVIYMSKLKSFIKLLNKCNCPHLT